MESLTKHARMGYDAVTNAPVIAGWKMILNVPAFIIVALITALAYVGIKESKERAPMRW